MLGGISTEAATPSRFPDPNVDHLVSQVSIKAPREYGSGDKRIIVVDCGAKENIIRSLLKFPYTLCRVPHDYDYSGEEFDGVFLSNGPGDPTRCFETIQILKKAMDRSKPIYGICLGAQIMALAAGARTYKLPFGHRGHNQPCLDRITKRCIITSQNHGYAIDANTLPDGWTAHLYNLNDGSVEGICHRSQPFCAVQFHPEAAPGPTDPFSFFEDFYNSVCRHANANV